MVLALVFASKMLAVEPPTKLQVVLNKREFKQGEKITVDLVVKNGSSKRIAVCLVKRDGRMSGGAYIQLFKGGKEVFVPTQDSSTPAMQTIEGYEVTSDRFRALEPRQIVNVFCKVSPLL